MNQYQPHLYLAAPHDFDDSLAHLSVPVNAPDVAPPPIHVHDNDILMGRGGKSNMHVGNENLRQLARAEVQQYEKADKNTKSIMAIQLVAQVHSLTPPGRFLKRDTTTMTWQLVPAEWAREKASQCLRDSVSKLKKCPNSAFSSFGSSSHGCNESSTSKKSQSIPLVAQNQKQQPKPEQKQKRVAKKQRHFPPDWAVSQNRAVTAGSPTKATHNPFIVNMETLTKKCHKRNRTTTTRTCSHQGPPTRKPLNDDSTTNSIPTLGDPVERSSPTPLLFRPAMVSRANSPNFDLDFLGEDSHSLLNEQDDVASLIDQDCLGMLDFQF
jgi:hypothetical protein